MSLSLSHLSGAVLDQCGIGSCMQNALVSALDLQMRQSGHEIGLRSRLQSYADTRNAQGTFHLDSGSAPEVTLMMAQTKGLASEQSWVYDPALLYTQPAEGVYAEASAYKVMSYSVVDTATQYGVIADRVEALLNEGKPVILAFRAGSAFFSQSGPLALQTNHWAWSETGSGHAAVIERIDRAMSGGTHIVKNSWGANWGDNGYGTIRFDQFHGLSNDLIGMYTINGFAGHDWTFTSAREEAAELYAFALDRSGDASGIRNLGDLIASGAMSKQDIAEWMIHTAEGQLIFPPAWSSAQTADQMYLLVCGRHADNGNLAALMDGGWTKGQALVLLMDAIDEYTGTDAATKLEAARYDNLTDMSEYYGIAMEGAGQYAAESLDDITHDPLSLEIAKIGLVADLGYI